MQSKLESRLIDLLVRFQGDGVCNQYRESHPEHDLPQAHTIRLENLSRFLGRFHQARYILLAEAAGYQGCRFSGIPMTSEAQIVGPEAVHWVQGDGFARSSRRARLSARTVGYHFVGDARTAY